MLDGRIASKKPVSKWPRAVKTPVPPEDNANALPTINIPDPDNLLIDN